MRSLDLAGRRYRIVSTGSTAEAQLAAVSAGLAVTAALPHDLPEGLRIAGVSDGLPQLPEVSLLMVKSREPRQPATDALHAHIVETFGAKSHAA